MVTQSVKLPKHKFDFSHRLPDGWKSTLEVNDIQWIAQSVFAGKGVLVSELKMWWYPPQLPGPDVKTAPVVDSYTFTVEFFFGCLGKCGPSTLNALIQFAETNHH